MFPFLAKIGSVPIPSQTVFWCLGYLISAAIMIFLSFREGLPKQKMLNLLILTMGASIIGARISAILLLTQPAELAWYLDHPGHFFHFWKAGYSLYGVAFFGSAACLWYSLRSGLPVLRIADLFIPGFALGHFVQNIGDFLAGAHPGIPTGLPWGVAYHDRAFSGLKGIPLHPVMLYVMIIGLLGFVMAVSWLRIRNNPGKKFFLSGFFSLVFRFLRLRFIDGEMFVLSGAFYAFFRFFVEFSRDPRTLVWYPDFPLPQTQVACLGLFAISYGVYFILRAIQETEQKGLPYRGWMKSCLRLAEGFRRLARVIPWPADGKR